MQILRRCALEIQYGHVKERHPRNAVVADELHKFRETITISEEEETKMGIPADKQGQSVRAYESHRMNDLSTVRNIQEDSPRRPRQTPFSSVPPQPFHLPIPPLFHSQYNSSFNDPTDPFH